MNFTNLALNNECPITTTSRNSGPEITCNKITCTCISKVLFFIDISCDVSLFVWFLLTKPRFRMQILKMFSLEH